MAVAALFAATASAQDDTRSSSSLYLPAYKKADVSMAFDTKGEGIRFQPTWGLDLAWINGQNLKKGVNHMGKENVGIGRSSFRVLNPLKGDTALTNDQISGLRERSNLFNQVVSTTLPLVLNCDNGYRPSGHTGPNVNAYYTTKSGNTSKANIEHWSAMIAAHVAWMQKNTKHPIVGVSPFNEPDYENGELYQGTAANERDVAKALKQNYAEVLDGAVIAGGNTLNDDQALNWYVPGKQYYDWGNTHQLAGSFANFARFYQQVAKDGKVGYDDEMHNTVEAMVGLEYGMTVGIWWGFDSRTRGEFCQISRHGERLAYGEHRNNWTAASVWRHDDGRIKAFIGSSERQGATTTYQFVSHDRDVYYDGYGPMREFMMEIPGGKAGSYQNGQTNAERVIDVTWGEDVAPCALNGIYKLVNKKTGAVVGYTNNGSNIMQQKFSATNKKQQWTVKPCSSRTGGDYSFYDIESVDNPKIRMNVRDYSTGTADLIAWTQDAPTSNEQWYLEYAGDGYYYLRNRESALYMASAANTISKLIQTPMLTEAARDRMLFRFLPIDVEYETAAPAQPSGLTADAHPASVTLSWTANQDEDLEGYMVIRAPKGTEEWNTIARKLTTTTFTDNNCRQGTIYIYKVKAIDQAQNLSEASEAIEAMPTGEPAMVACWQMEDNVNDATENMMDGAVGGSANYIEGGMQGQKALRLTASANQYVQLPYEVANSDELTVSMWVFLRNSASKQHLFDFGYDANHYLYLTPNNGTVLSFAIKNGGDEQVVKGQSKLPTSQWKHVAVTMAKDKTAIYVDGEEVASSTGITIRPNDIGTVLNYLGRSQSLTDALLSADLDDVRIYNYAVSAEDVKTIMGGGQVTAVHSPSSLTPHPSSVYGLDGVKRSAMQKGLNIVDGKKVVK